MKHPSSLLLTSLLLAACGDAPVSDILDEGAWTLSMPAATLSTASGSADATDTTVELALSGELVDAYFTSADSTAYCLNGGDEASYTYAILCGYEGSGFVFSYDAGQLYPTHPEGTLVGPTTLLELFGQYNPSSLEERDVTVNTDDPTPTPAEATPAVEATPTPTPSATPTPTTKHVYCTRTIYHTLYGQLESRTQARVILRVADLSTCVDVDGNEVPEAFQGTWVTGEGSLVASGTP